MKLKLMSNAEIIVISVDDTHCIPVETKLQNCIQTNSHRHRRGNSQILYAYPNSFIQSTPHASNLLSQRQYTLLLIRWQL